jgi:hypothetical protein
VRSKQTEVGESSVERHTWGGAWEKFNPSWTEHRCIGGCSNGADSVRRNQASSLTRAGTCTIPSATHRGHARSVGLRPVPDCGRCAQPSVAASNEPASAADIGAQPARAAKKRRVGQSTWATSVLESLVIGR